MLKSGQISLVLATASVTASIMFSSAELSANHHASNDKKSAPLEIEKLMQRFDSHSQEKFQRADADFDNFLSLDEFAQWQKKPNAGHKESRRGERMILRLMTPQSGDEKIRAEVDSLMFELLDEDGDGSINREEFLDSEKRMLTHRARVAVLFKEFDQNGDNLLSVGEMPNPEHQLQEIDGDGDGILDPQEIRAFVKNSKYRKR